jgi:hypothetical protein
LSRLRFLDDCTVGDSWATDGMTLCFLDEIRKVAIGPGPLESSKDRVRRKYFYSGYGRIWRMSKGQQRHGMVEARR